MCSFASSVVMKTSLFTALAHIFSLIALKAFVFRLPTAGDLLLINQTTHPILAEWVYRHTSLFYQWFTYCITVNKIPQRLKW